MNPEIKGVRKRGVLFLEGGREWILPGLLYENDLTLCGMSEKDLSAMVGRFVEVCRRRSLKVNAGKHIDAWDLPQTSPLMFLCFIYGH